jgi:predicted nucleotidyltransferase
MDRLNIARRFRDFLDFPEIEEVILYGSVARGDDYEGSDIDILVISRDKFHTKSKLYPKVGDFLLDEGVYISVKVISPEEYQDMRKTYFFSQIKKEGVVLE